VEKETLGALFKQGLLFGESHPIFHQTAALVHERINELVFDTGLEKITEGAADDLLHKGFVPFWLSRSVLGIKHAIRPTSEE
jgi:hypothetical protein